MLSGEQLCLTLVCNNLSAAFDAVSVVFDDMDYTTLKGIFSINLKEWSLPSLCHTINKKNYERALY